MGVYATRRTFPSLKKRAAHPVQAGTGGASMLSGAHQAGLIVVVVAIVIVIAVIIVIIVVIVVAIRLAVVV